MALKILFITPYPAKVAPSQRFRFEQYFSALQVGGHKYKVVSFLNSRNWQLFFKPGQFIPKLSALLRGYVHRLFLLSQASTYDVIFIHREATPIGPPVFEWIIARVLRKKIIYDFDDAIWLTDRTNESTLLRVLKWRSKVASICRWSYKISCGNAYLCDYALQFNPNVTYNPTTLDTESLHNPRIYTTDNQEDSVTLGWTGSHSTLKYLSAIEAILQKLEDEYPNISIIVIADKKPELTLRKLHFISWNILTEVQDLLKIDIGLMPLPGDQWSKGKCGFKILQYLALRIPAVASPVGINPKIIQHDKTGYLCVSDDDWYNALKKLIENKSLRNAFGERGREFVRANYSVFSNTANFLSLFE